ncbi:MAG: GGDEF domain-containing protein, partial [Pseudomonadota bacterium]
QKNALQDLDQAYKNFFNGDTGYPTERKRKDKQSFRIEAWDPLTGAGNRRALDETLKDRVGSSASEQAISIIMIDIDFFKQVNDEHGHAAGDRVLQTVAQSIVSNIRATDRLYRVGGEEFLVLAEGANIRHAQQLGEKLREEVAALRINVRAQHTAHLEVTISLGVAERMPSETADQWIKRADTALYDAKRSGRNQTSLADKTAFLSGTNTISIKNHARNAR